MTEKDPLDGFRGRAGATTADPEKAEAELRRRLGDDEALVDVLIVSERMEAWINADPVGKYVYKHAQDRLDAAIKTMFTETDPGNDRARAAHFEGRVAIAMLRMIDETLQAGVDAAQAITAETE
jgi:hypothetical protein